MHNIDTTSDDRYNGATCFAREHLDIVLKPFTGETSKAPSVYEHTGIGSFI